MFRLFLLLSIALYGVSLFLPVYEGRDAMGYMALALGWLVGANDWATAVSWLANIFYFMAFIVILKRKNPKPVRAMVYAIFATLLSLSVLAAGKAFVSNDSSKVIESFSLGTAFYAWLGSFVLMIVAAYLKSRTVNSQVATESADSTNVK